MRTSFVISDALFARAKSHAKKTGRPLRALVEEGLRLVLAAERKAPAYVLPDRSAGEEGGVNPLEGLSWQDLRSEIYGEGTRNDGPR